MASRKRKIAATQVAQGFDSIDAVLAKSGHLAELAAQKKAEAMALMESLASPRLPRRPWTTTFVQAAPSASFKARRSGYGSSRNVGPAQPVAVPEEEFDEDENDENNCMDEEEVWEDADPRWLEHERMKQVIKNSTVVPPKKMVLPPPPKKPVPLKPVAKARVAQQAPATDNEESEDLTDDEALIPYRQHQQQMAHLRAAAAMKKRKAEEAERRAAQALRQPCSRAGCPFLAHSKLSEEFDGHCCQACMVADYRVRTNLHTRTSKNRDPCLDHGKKCEKEPLREDVLYG